MNFKNQRKDSRRDLDVNQIYHSHNHPNNDVTLVYTVYVVRSRAVRAPVEGPSTSQNVVKIRSRAGPQQVKLLVNIRCRNVLCACSLEAPIEAYPSNLPRARVQPVRILSNNSVWETDAKHKSLVVIDRWVLKLIMANIRARLAFIGE